MAIVGLCVSHISYSALCIITLCTNVNSKCASCSGKLMLLYPTTKDDTS